MTATTVCSTRCGAHSARCAGVPPALSCPPAPARPYLTRVESLRRGCTTDEIDEAVENYQDEATRLRGEAKEELAEEEAIQEAQEAERQRQEAERQRQEAEGQAELAPVPIAGAPELQQPMAA